MSSPLQAAIKQICAEKGITEESVIGTIESALAAAYKKDYGEKNANIEVSFDPATGETHIFDVKTVREAPPEEELTTEGEAVDASVAAPIVTGSAETGVEAVEEERFNPKYHLTPDEAKAIKSDAAIGDEIRRELEVPPGYGRMAAQTAKQVIIQKLREAERNMLYDEFKHREHEMATGVVARRDGRAVVVDLGRINALMPPEEQIPRERYFPGDQIKVFVLSVREGMRGAEIIVSRAHPDIVRKLFEVEIPEVANGTVEIKAIAREGGERVKVAVASNRDNIDPIGSCVGQRGTRVQAIISELGGEKVDIIEYADDPATFIRNALAPAKVEEITLHEEEKRAIVKVPEDQLSLAISRGGQNVRLASKLTGWRIDILSADGKPVNDDGEIVATDITTDVADASVAPAAPEESKEEQQTEAPAPDETTA